MRDDEARGVGEGGSQLSEKYFLIESDQQSALDKALLTLSSASLGYSASFFSSSGDAGFCCKCFLFLSWVSFSCSICCTLVSFMKSVKAAREYRLYVENMNIDHGCEDCKDFGPEIEKYNSYSFKSFFVGLIAFLAFVTFNL